MSIIHTIIRHAGGIVFLLSVAIFLYDIRSGAILYSKLLKAAWPRERYGDSLVGSVNKGSITIGALLLLLFFLTSELRDWFKSEPSRFPWYFWLVCFCFLIGLMGISVIVLATIERGKLLMTTGPEDSDD